MVLINIDIHNLDIFKNILYHAKTWPRPFTSVLTILHTHPDPVRPIRSVEDRLSLGSLPRTHYKLLHVLNDSEIC